MSMTKSYYWDEIIADQSDDDLPDDRGCLQADLDAEEHVDSDTDSQSE
jgi:hypothetical protein